MEFCEELAVLQSAFILAEKEVFNFYIPDRITINYSQVQVLAKD